MEVNIWQKTKKKIFSIKENRRDILPQWILKQQNKKFFPIKLINNYYKIS